MKSTATALTHPSSIEAPRRAATVADLRKRLATEPVEQQHEKRAGAKIWEPTNSTNSTHSPVPTTDEVLHATQAAPTGLAPELEQAIVGVLVRPAQPGETYKSAGDERERELYQLLGQLSEVETYQLRRRLDQNRDGDVLAVAFRRLLQERRTRIRAFLADPRRRLAARNA